MTRIWAITRHTVAEGVRMRIVLLFLLVLTFIVLRLPFAVKGDETLAGRLQTFLAYSLTALSVLLAVATIFFSCATLGSEFRTRTLHVLLTKPVTRFEVLMGKWLGVNLLNLMIIVAAGVAIYGLGTFIRQQPVEFQRDRVKVDQVVWTAREAAVPKMPEFRESVAVEIDALMAQGEQFSLGREIAIRDRIQELREEWMRIPPGEAKIYTFEGLGAPDDPSVVIQVRFKVRAMPPPPDEVILIQWGIRDPQTGGLLETIITEERQGEFHEFLIRAQGIVRDDTAELIVINPSNPFGPYPLTIFFEGNQGLQLLYETGSFEWNYFKALLLIFFRLAFLSAVAVFFSTFVSFPVACFCCLSIYLFCIGAPFWLEAIGANMEVYNPRLDPLGPLLGPIIRQPILLFLRLLLPDFFGYDGIDMLIDGNAIAGSLIRQAALHTVVYGALLLALPGWMIFRRREVAEVIV